MKLTNAQIGIAFLIFSSFLIGVCESTSFTSLFSEETWRRLSARRFLKKRADTNSSAASNSSDASKPSSTDSGNSTNSTNSTNSSSSLVPVNFDDPTHQLALFYYSFFNGLSMAAYKVLFNISKEWIDCSNSYDFQNEYQKSVFVLKVLDIVDQRTRAIDNQKVQTLLSAGLNTLFDTIVKKTYDNPQCASLKALIDKTLPISSNFLKNWKKVVGVVNSNTVLVKFPNTPLSNYNQIGSGNIQVNSVAIGVQVRKINSILVTPFDRVAGYLGNIANMVARTVIKF